MPEGERRNECEVRNVVGTRLSMALWAIDSVP